MKRLVTLLLCSAALSTTQARDGLLIRALDKHQLSELKKETALYRPVFTTGKRCFNAAQSVAEANACNSKVREMARQVDMEDFEVDDFNKWNDSERHNVLGIIDETLRYLDCLDNAATVDAAMKCEEP